MKNWVCAGALFAFAFLFSRYWDAFAALISLAAGAALPLLAGAVIAYAANIVMSFYERHLPRGREGGAWAAAKRPVCMLAAFISIIAVFVVVITMIVPELAACVALLLEQLPGALKSLTAWLSRTFESDAALIDKVNAYVQGIDWKAMLEQSAAVLLTGVGSVAGAVGSVFSSVVTLLVALVFSVYLLSGKERLGAQAKRLLTTYAGEKISQKALYVLSTVNHAFHSYIVGQCVEAVILGSLCALGMLIFGFPYAAMIGALVGVTALIPIAGAYIGGGVGAFMIFTVSPIKAVLFIVYLLVLQQLEGNLIYPRVVGSSIGLPGIWVLSAVTIGGGILGIPGMLLGVPLAAAAYQLLRSDVKKREGSAIKGGTQ